MKREKRVLFSTDFSDSSREAFQRFLPAAKSFGMEVVLFYSVFLPASAFVAGYGAMSVMPDDYFSSQEKWAREEGARWVELAQAYGVPARFIVKNDGISSVVADSILATARDEKVSLVAMASLSGAFTSFAIGSVAREVFRKNEFSVWVYGPQSLTKEDESLLGQKEQIAQ